MSAVGLDEEGPFPELGGAREESRLQREEGREGVELGELEGDISGYGRWLRVRSSSHLNHLLAWNGNRKLPPGVGWLYVLVLGSQELRDLEPLSITTRHQPTSLLFEPPLISISINKLSVHQRNPKNPLTMHPTNHPAKRQKREDYRKAQHAESSTAELPQKKFYRQRAHANPFSDHALT